MIVAEGKIRDVREEIHERPIKFLVRCRDASRVAALLFNECPVTEVRLNEDRLGLLVMAKDSEQLSRSIGRIALDGHSIDSVIPVDDNVDALYEYLIGEGNRS
jgi:hypothetical protein